MSMVISTSSGVRVAMGASDGCWRVQGGGVGSGVDLVLTWDSNYLQFHGFYLLIEGVMAAKL